MKPPTFLRLVFLSFILLILRKICIAVYSMSTVFLHGNDLSNEEFTKTLATLNNKSYVLFLNKYAVNMTLNWLCNTVDMPGVHENSLFLTMDQEATFQLLSAWPFLKVVRLHVPALEDTFWREALPQAMLETGDLSGADIVFDAAGGYYFVRPTLNTVHYFEKLVTDLSWWYAPDNGYMTYLCYKQYARCANMPFSWITNWQWMLYPNDDVPYFVQFDGYTKLGGKLACMKEMGFFFMDEVMKQCNSTATQKAQQMVSSAQRPSLSLESGHAQFATYSKLIEYFQSNWLLSLVLYNFLLPFGHYAMLTM